MRFRFSSGGRAAPDPLRSYQALKPQLQEVLLHMLPPGRAIFLRRLKAKVTKAQRSAQKRAAREQERQDRLDARAARRAAVRCTLCPVHGRVRSVRRVVCVLTLTSR